MCNLKLVWDLSIFYRQAKVICPEDPTPPTQDKEDWENEIQEVSLTDFPDWEKMCFGVRPYGKEKTFKYYNFPLHSTVLILYTDTKGLAYLCWLVYMHICIKLYK